MGLCDNPIVFILICLLTFLLNLLSICEASDEVLCIPTERKALLTFKQHLLDPLNRLAFWSEDTNCCNWTSVACNPVTGHILQLHLSTSIPPWYMDPEYDAYEESRFGGELHPSMLDLKELSFLDMSGNYFGGTLLPSFLGSMKSLTYLNLSYAGFSGSIPHQIGNLSGLRHLDLGGNDFTGKIPHQIGNISNLLYLRLSGEYQYVMGGLPMYAENLQWISSLSPLQYLDLSYVNMSNALDWLLVLQALPSLIELHFSSCALHHNFQPATAENFSSLTILDLFSSFDFGYASIPKWIFQLKNLVSLKLSGNQLQGSIPNGIHNLSLIEDLDLSSNLFNSSIPDWLYSLKNLESLNLLGNNLHGTIPYAIGNLTSMVTLTLSENQLEGSFPSSLSRLCYLKSVSFSNKNCNQQVFEILDIFSKCASNTLETLSITSSNLFGHLTAQIGIFKNLRRLNLYDNSLQGALPIALGNLTYLNYLYLSGNQFEGNPFDVIQSLYELQGLGISDNLFQGIVNEYHLVNFTRLRSFSSLGNKLNLKVSPNWKPSFQNLRSLYIDSWHLGPKFPSWIQSLKYLRLLHIPNNNISDSIPTWVWHAFPHAYDFDFSNNDIHGELSYTLKSPINVSSIDLSSNDLSGPLPHISSYVNYLDLSSNWFSGSIAFFLCQGKEEPMRLEYLNLASNNLSGEISDCWKMWSNNLMIIKVDNNHLKGNLPASIGSLYWLNSLQLRNNTLSGIFPICLKNNTKLVLLDLRDNDFSGIIPPWVGDILLNLKVFLLKSNKFNGKIPNQICSLTSLHILDLAHNNLIGQIPKCINQLSVMLVKNTTQESYIQGEGNGSSSSITNVLLELKGRNDVYTFLGLVTSIDLSHNKLCGEIPNEMTSLKGLHFLDLSNNLLSGKIPQNIGNMESLETMDLSKNKLSGEIPLSVSNLNFLSKLNLSYNNLSGKIPTATQLQSLDASSFVGNDLFGPPILKNCNDMCSVPNHDTDDKQGKGNGINWFYVSMSLGFVSGFWAVVGPLLYSRSWRYTYFWFIDRMWYNLQSYWC